MKRRSLQRRLPCGFLAVLIVLLIAGRGLGATPAAPNSPELLGEKPKPEASETLGDLLGEKPPPAPTPTPEVVLPGIGLPIRYELARPGKVSLNIYDETGQVVQELLRVTQREAGPHLEIWNGKDRFGQPVPPGKYSWKLVSTPGLKAEFLLKVGTNYPLRKNADWWQQAPGDITGPGSIFADDSGLYVGAATENIGPCIVKLTLDGSERLWERKLQSAYTFPRGWARLGDTLWIFSANDKSLLPIDAKTGADAGKPISTLWEKDGGHQMAPVGGLLAVSYPKKNAVRWFDPATGQVTATLEIPKAAALAGFQNLLYVSDGNAIWKVTLDTSEGKIEALPFAQGLAKVAVMATDPTTGDLFVYEGGQYGGGNSQVKRFSPEGKPLQAYGRPGGRQHGLYTREEQESFTAVYGLTGLPDGGFAVAEAWAPPRRAATFDKDGRLQNEWYGAQMWAPFIFPEPDNPNAVWMASDWNGFMRLLVDYDQKTWKVHSTYRWGGMPLGPASADIGSGMKGFVRDGQLYLQPEGRLELIKVDREKGKAQQVAVHLSDLQTRYGQKRNELSPLAQEWMAPHSLKNLWLDSLWWLDANSDGQPQREEVQWRRKTGTGKIWTDANADGQLQPEEESKDGLPLVQSPFLDSKMNVHWLDKNFRFSKLPVKEWTVSGVPVFGSMIEPPPVSAPKWLIEQVKGPYFSTVDPATGDVYVAANNFKGWAASDASYLVKIGADGNFKWAVGGAGSNPGQIRYFRRMLGVVKGCVAATNTSNEWASEYLPRTYVWDSDGLYLGGLLDNPQLKPDEPLWHFAAGAEAKNGVVWEDPKSGEVYYFGHWTNEGRIYKITGWDGWERFAGNLELTETPGKGGNGLTASLLNADDQVVEQWLSPQAAFDSAKDLKSPAGRQLVQKGPFGVRFFGKLKPPTDGDYQFSVKAPGRVRLVLDGRVVLDTALADKLKPLALNPIPLRAKESPWIQLEVWPLSGKPEPISLQWSRDGATAEPVPSLALSAIPNPDAIPFGEGIGLSATYYRRVISPKELASPTAYLGEANKEQIDPEINSTDKEFSVVWKGYFQPRNTGWTRLRGGGDYVMRLKILDRLACEHYVYLEAGKKYPIAAYARAWTDVHNSKYHFQIKASRWTAPNTTNENLVSIPQSQLFPESNEH